MKAVTTALLVVSLFSFAQLALVPGTPEPQNQKELVDSLGLWPGMVVADIGTGEGHLLPYLSRTVGARGKVIAEEIQADYLKQAKARAVGEKLANVQFVLGSEGNPKLAVASIDVALVLDDYQHFGHPEQMLAHLRSALKPGGRLYVVDYYKRSRPDLIRLELDEAVREIEASGFDFLAKRNHSTEQYMLTFVRP